MEYLQITVTGWVALSIALSMALLAGLMFILGTERSHFIWGLFCVAIATWAGGFYMVTLVQTPDAARFWWKISYIGLILNPFLYTHFTLEFINSAFFKKYKLVILTLIYSGAAVFLSMDLRTDLIIGQVTQLFGDLYYNTPPGPMYIYFMTVFPILVCSSLYFIIHEYRRRTDDAQFRSQAIYFFIASAIAYVGGSMNFLPIYGINVNPISNFAVAFGATFIAYAILKYRLFNVKVVTAQLLTLVLTLFTLIRIFVSNSAQEIIFNAAFLAFTLIIGVYLIRSVKREVEQRELIELQERELEKVNIAQENLLHFISHEIKGYLAKSEAAFAAIAEGDYGPVSDDLKGMTTMSLNEMRKGVRTVMDILDASNLKKGTVLFAKKQFDLSGAVDRVVNDLKPTADDKHLALAWQKPTAAISIEGDEEKLVHHVIRNLIDNSIKYTPQGKVAVSLERKEGVARFVVQDTGIGITDEDKQRLFTEGGRGKDSIRINVHSTGYGLYIAKQVVQAQGGKIWAESDGVGKGSRFIVELPAI